MKQKKYIALLLTLIMLVMSVPNVAPVYASELSLVNGYYEIRTENDFYLIKDYSANYKIVADITLTKEFETIGSLKNPFKGKLIGAKEGGGKEAPVITVKSDNFKGLVGYLNGGQVSGIALAGNIKTNADVVGGIVNTVKSGKIKKCINNANIESTYNGMNKVYVGGIVGKTEAPNSLTLTNCENNGDIICNTTTKGYVGGIAGRVVFAYEKGEFSDCINTGKIKASVENVGGVAGNLYTQLTANNLFNEGEIASTGDAAYAGGIVGAIQGSISRAYNTNKVTAKNVAAGIVGSVIANDSYKFENAYNAGEIAGAKKSAGIIGSIDGNKNQNIVTSYNAGELTDGVTYQISPLNNVINKYNYYLASQTAINSMLSPMSEEDMKVLSHFNGFSTDVWDIPNDSEYPYPQFKSDKVNLEEKGYFYVEAEDILKKVSDADIVSSSEAAGGKYLQFNRSFYELNAVSPTLEEPSMNIKFTLTEAKTVTAYVRISTIDGGDDNFWVGYDESYVHKGASSYGVGFYWQKIISQTLEPGEHTLDFQNREKIKIDKFYLTTESIYFPSGLGNPPDAPVEPVYFHKEGSLKPLVTGHPRVYINEEDIPGIIENLTHPQNANMYARHLKYLADTRDGNLPDKSANTDQELLQVLESRAFQYVLYKEENYGRQAIDGIINYISTWDMGSASSADLYSLCGEVIHKLAIIYDWCYPLLTAEEKNKMYKLFVYVCSGLEVGYPPAKQGWITGHGSETQMFRDYLSAAIAFYDEYPFLYDGVSGVVIDEMLPYRKWFYESQMHPEGEQYNVMRFTAEVSAMLLLDGIGYPAYLGENQKYISYWFIYARRPDGKTLRNADTNMDMESPFTYRVPNFEPTFYMASYFKDPFLKEEVMRMNNGLMPVSIMANRSLSPTEFLIYNDPYLDGAPSKNLPLTHFFPSPYGEMVARTGWNYGVAANDVVANMKIKEWDVFGHSHHDSGAFQIYYKGALAVDSGMYQTSWGYGTDGQWLSGDQTLNNGNTYYGSPYFYNWSKRTIAHNCMLVYDPDEYFTNDQYGNPIENDGGQKYHTRSAPADYETFLSKYDSDYKRGETLAHEFGLDPMEPNYTYLKGDLSYAYTDKVEEFERSFMFLNLKNDEVPAVMMVFDHVVSSNPSFKKTWLLHTIDEEPKVVSQNRTVVTNTREGYNGKLTVDTLFPEVPNIEIIKGNVVNGTDYITIPIEGGINESTGYRLEVSPSVATQEDYFLNVIQISDADSEKEPLKVGKIGAGTHYGAVIYDRVVLFGKERDRMATDVSFEFTGEGNYEITVTDLVKGTWKVTKDGSAYADAVVTEEGGIAVINGAAGKYTLTFTSEEGVRPEYQTSHVPVEDVFYIKNADQHYVYTEGYIENGVAMMPAHEFADYIHIDYEFNADKTAVTFKGYGKEMTLTANSNYVQCSLGDFNVVNTPVIKNGHLNVPLREIAERFYQKIGYEPYPGIISTTCTASDPEEGYTTIVDCDWIGNLDTTNGYQSYDKSTSTGWATAAAAGTGNCEVTYHFGSPQPVSQIEILFSRPNARTFKYDILVSNDKVNWTTIVKDGESILAQDAMEWQTIDLKGTQQVTYLKYVGKGNSGSNANNILEIKFKK